MSIVQQKHRKCQGQEKLLFSAMLYLKRLVT